MNRYVCCFLGMICVAKAEVKLGMWSWNQSAYVSKEARVKMLDFCKKEGIARVDQHLSFGNAKNGSGRALKNSGELKSLLHTAGKVGVKISALRGERDMFFAEKHERTLTELKKMIEFNLGQAKGEKFYAVKYDVEPYLTDEWRAGGAKRKKVMKDYLKFLLLARKELDRRKSSLKLMVDVPFWWDEEEHIIDIGGESKPFGQHVQDHTDGIGIMSYRRSAKDVMKLSEGEIAYGKKLGKEQAVSVGLEVIEIKGKEAFISFWGTPVKNYRKTVKELQKGLARESSVDLIMVHSYSGLKKYLGK